MDEVSNIVDGLGLDARRGSGYNWGMIDETVEKIESAIKQARTADPKNKEELIKLLEQLKAEMQSERRSDVLRAADEELRHAAIGFDASHPQLGAVVAEISNLLASIGI